MPKGYPIGTQNTHVLIDEEEFETLEEGRPIMKSVTHSEPCWQQIRTTIMQTFLNSSRLIALQGLGITEWNNTNNVSKKYGYPWIAQSLTVIHRTSTHWSSVWSNSLCAAPFWIWPLALFHFCPNKDSATAPGTLNGNNTCRKLLQSNASKRRKTQK